MATEYHYNKFPPQFELDEEIHQLVNRARTNLGRYDGFLVGMLNAETLLSPLFTQEAVLSSRIEGTQSTLTEVLEFEANNQQQDLPEPTKEDRKEVLNYRYALYYATDAVSNKNFPLSTRLLKEMHRELMHGVRGQNMAPGEFRKTPVWIGPDKSKIEMARYIPINAQHINNAMNEFEKYLHYSREYDDLIKIAILHAEFEAIHPFLDGNGRLGRMFIPLYLSAKKLLRFPSFYISSYFEQNRDSYYTLLLNVSKYNDWLNWCKFFLRGVVVQAEDNFNRAVKILEYYRQLKENIPKISKSPYGITALDFIFKNNYFASPRFFKEAGIPKSSAHRLLQIFTEKEILLSIDGNGRKPNFYIFKNLIDIADGKQFVSHL